MTIGTPMTTKADVVIANAKSKAMAAISNGESAAGLTVLEKAFFHSLQNDDLHPA